MGLGLVPLFAAAGAAPQAVAVVPVVPVGKRAGTKRSRGNSAWAEEPEKAGRPEPGWHNQSSRQSNPQSIRSREAMIRSSSRLGGAGVGPVSSYCRISRKTKNPADCIDDTWDTPSAGLLEGCRQFLEQQDIRRRLARSRSWRIMC